MMQTELTTKNIAALGEEISHDLGAQMISDFQAANPADTKCYQLGRNIINQILSQPGCAGMRFYNAYDENGEKTLVYLGVDEAGNPIAKYTVVNHDGSFGEKKAIVADRIDRPTPGGNDTEWWENTIS